MTVSLHRWHSARWGHFERSSRGDGSSPLALFFSFVLDFWFNGRGSRAPCNQAGHQQRETVPDILRWTLVQPAHSSTSKRESTGATRRRLGRPELLNTTEPGPGRQRNSLKGGALASEGTASDFGHIVGVSDSFFFAFSTSSIGGQKGR